MLSFMYSSPQHVGFVNESTEPGGTVQCHSFDHMIMTEQCSIRARASSRVFVCFILFRHELENPATRRLRPLFAQ